MEIQNINGILIYDIHSNGNLTGIWTNTVTDKTFTEMAIKNDEVIGLSGTYLCAYYDAGNKLKNTVLTISNEDSKLYFEWEENGKIIFKGIGLHISPNKIGVSFWLVN